MEAPVRIINLLTHSVVKKPNMIFTFSIAYKINNQHNDNLLIRHEHFPKPENSCFCSTLVLDFPCPVQEFLELHCYNLIGTNYSHRIYFKTTNINSH